VRLVHVCVGLIRMGEDWRCVRSDVECANGWGGSRKTRGGQDDRGGMKLAIWKWQSRKSLGDQS